MLVERESILYQGTRIPVTISLGVAMLLSGEMTTATELIRRADAKLYEAKRLGRNRVIV